MEKTEKDSIFPEGKGGYGTEESLPLFSALENKDSCFASANTKHENEGKVADPPFKNKKKRRAGGALYFLLGAVVTAAIFAVILLFVCSSAPSQRSFEIGKLKVTIDGGTDNTTAKASEKLVSMLRTISANYYRELEPSELLEAMSAGISQNLDSPYSYYLNAEDFEKMKESEASHYSGIGATVSAGRDGIFEIVDLTPGGPAAESDILPGDRFVSVNGVKTQDMKDISKLVGLVKGPEGSEVILEMFRPSEMRSFQVKIKRRDVKSIYVREKMIDDKTACISVTEFSDTMPEQFQSALEAVLKKGANSIIFDMRNNPGGQADACRKILDMLLGDCLLTTVKGRDSGEPFTDEWRSSSERLTPENIKYAILVNENTASAAELFTGAMRDSGEAFVIGEQTYGKGSGTRFYVMEDGSAVNVTIFKYYFPDGECPEGVGISPQYNISNSETAKSKPLQSLSLEEDMQLSKAVSLLAR